MRRKRKLKKVLVLLIIIILVVSLLVIGYHYLFKEKNNDNITKTNYTELEKEFLNLGYNKNELNYIKKLSSTNQDKLKNIDYINIKNYYNLKNFDVYNYERYEKYKNDDISYEDVVTKVNIGLDQKFYTNTSPALDQDKITILVNKYYYVDKDFIPKNLVTLFDSKQGAKMVDVAASNYKELVLAAKDDGITLESTTAYRSYNFQNTLYTNYVKKDGIEKADTYSARPGYSEHQTGLAVDLNDPTVSGSRLDQKDYDWLLNNAHNYGFIVRYQEKYIPITGYMEEPWHIRYVGKEIATEMHKLDITYEEYYDLYLTNY